MSRALTRVYPAMQLNYEQVLISKGRLPGVVNAKVALNAKSILQCSFVDNGMDGIASPGDQVILVAYAPDLQQAILTLYGGFPRDKKAVLNVAAFKGHAIET